MNVKLYTSLVVLVACIQVALSQPLQLEIHDLRSNTIPLFRFKTILTQGGAPLQRPGSANYTLAENGVPVPFTIVCPSVTDASISLVLDNSGSMGKVVEALGVAASRLVDSLRPMDECQLLTFDKGGTIAQDFTNNKSLLKNVLSNLVAGGSTPLYATMQLAFQELAQRPGRRFCVVLTDGDDNGGGDPDALLQFAIDNNIIVYTIGFGHGVARGSILRKFTDETGGIFFRTGVEEDLDGIYDGIASDIVSPYCTVTYNAAGCEDSIRVLTMTASIGNEQASVTEVIQSPFRQDTLHLHVEAPEEVGPLGNALVYLRLDEALHTGLQLSFSFLIKYDHNLLEVDPVTPITAWTITQNTMTRLQVVRQGVLRCYAEVVTPGMPAGNLVGWRFKGLVQDSSRRVHIVIDSLELNSGCPNVVISYMDSIEVCQCKRAVKASIPDNTILSAAEVRLPIVVSDTMLTATTLFTSQIEYDARYLTPINVDGMGAITENAVLTWDIPADGILEVRTQNSFTPVPGKVLYYVRFKTSRPKPAVQSEMVLPVVRAYSDCCPDSGTATTEGILLDGNCDKIVRLKVSFTLEPLAPNPAYGDAVFRFKVYENRGLDGAQADLSIYDAKGKRVARVYDGAVSPGEKSIHVSLQNYEAGVYYSVLSIRNQVQTSAFVVVK
jgi:VWFA-related protein